MLTARARRLVGFFVEIALVLVDFVVENPVEELRYGMREEETGFCPLSSQYSHLQTYIEGRNSQKVLFGLVKEDVVVDEIYVDGQEHGLGD